MATSQVFTIGYEGRNIDDFIIHLKNFRITRLIDVRELPLSRKRGFSKSTLAARLESENIQYVHIRSLGSPADVRHRLKGDHDYVRFFEAIDHYLDENEPSLLEAYRLIKDGLSCIMCFERKPEMCHRFSVVQKIKEIDGNGLIVSHI
jgi:uncharacterized protein (DUF488 family)